MSSVSARSNCIAFLAPSSYILAASLSRILMFFLRLVDATVSEMSSMYERTLAVSLGKSSLM